jgi:hypothetical protein
MSYKKYLKESTTAGAYAETGPKAIAGDDDFPTGNIIMGDRYKKTGYDNRLTSFDVNWVPDDSNWGWVDFDSTKPQSSVHAYHDTLKGDEYFLSDRLFKKMHTKDIPDVPTSSRLLGGKIGPFADAWGNPADSDEFEKTADMDGEDDAEREERKKKGKTYKPKVMRDVIKKINGLL